MNNAIVWFRHDLRITNNAALYKAAQNNHVIAIYVEATEQRKLHYDSTQKIGLLFDSLIKLKESLEEYNIPLSIITVDYYSDIPEQILQLAKKYNATSLWFNREYLINELARDSKVEKLLLQENVKVHPCDCDLILEPNSVKKNDGTAYKVFTPYKKAWIKTYQQIQPNGYPKPNKQSFSMLSFQYEHHDFSENYRKDLWPAGEYEAKKRLRKFSGKIESYKDLRDIPSKPNTSMLSPYLAIGTISALECVHAIFDIYHADEEKIYKDTWLSELIWREFYRQIIIDNPHLAQHKPFKPQAKEPWENNHHIFEAWKNGQTGFPLVDAAMRQLKQTGWMHNRLRMNTAMFLSKLCFIDWRWGEKYFMESLIDGDFYSNNGGWQWCSSTGADSAPYFRIMNPTTQSERFDKDGDFIRLFVPELSELNNKSIHNPSPMQRKECNYPMPIINYNEARKKSIEMLA